MADDSQDVARPVDGGILASDIVAGRWQDLYLQLLRHFNGNDNEVQMWMDTPNIYLSSRKPRLVAQLGQYDSIQLALDLIDAVNEPLTDAQLEEGTTYQQ